MLVVLVPSFKPKNLIRRRAAGYINNDVHIAGYRFVRDVAAINEDGGWLREVDCPVYESFKSCPNLSSAPIGAKQLRSLNE